MGLDAGQWLGVGLSLIATSAPLCVTLYFKLRNAAPPSPPAIVVTPPNGSKVDVREFLEFKTEIKQLCDEVKAEIAVIHKLIVSRW